MKICIAQTIPIKGDVKRNIKSHLIIIGQAIKSHADAIFFPELSITGYEPELARELATNVENSIFNPFQVLSDQNEITIGVGMPIKSKEGIQICILLFQPKKKRKVYSKQMLHEDELPYFVGGHEQIVLRIKGTKIGLGICYETLQRAQFLKTYELGIDIYLASVAKSQSGIDQAYLHFSTVSKEFQTPILMTNCVGYCDNFLSSGQSAVWNQKGDLIGQLDSENEGLLLYDTELETIVTSQLIIEKAQMMDKTEVFQLYVNAKIGLESEGIFQWTDNYPSAVIVENDIKKGNLFLLKDGNLVIGAINISDEHEVEYQSINWAFSGTNILVIRRLVIHPRYQHQGYAAKIMDFAEEFAFNKNYTSIRLDTYSQNNRAVEFYKKRDYILCGDVLFPKRKHPFHCMEKQIKS